MKLSTKLLLIFASMIFAATFVFILFKWSENIVHYNNKFKRRFPPHTAQEEYKLDLKFNSYYFAGSANGKIYLGNVTAPLKMTVLDTTTHKTSSFQIELFPKNLPFKAPQIRVIENHFFVFEGTVPYVFKGSITNWKAQIRLRSGQYFSHLVPIDSLRLAIRYLAPKTGESVIGVLNISDTNNVKYNNTLLEKEFDGIFDTDGNLMVDHKLNRIVYNYRYRNEYWSADPNLKLSFRAHTIDTIGKAQIKITKVESRNYRTFTEPPLVVNHLNTVDAGHLFVNSLIPGLEEPENIWKQASIIDVYDLSDQSYQSSFPVYKIGRIPMRGFLVSGNHLFALVDNHIVCYKLREHLTVSGKIK